jgi:hypothetical protein
MAIKRCFTCKGSKVVVGLGGLEKKCSECSGIGYKEIADSKEVDDFLNQEPAETVEIKKPGRKKKVA